MNSDNKPWNLLSTKKSLGLQVFYSEAVGTPLRRFKAVCTMANITVDKVYEFILHQTSTRERLKWDRNISLFDERLVAHFSQPQQVQTVKILRTCTKKVGPVSAREFIDVCCVVRLPDGSIASAGAGLLQHETCGHYPPAKGYVRAVNLAGCGWHFVPSGPEGKDITISFESQGMVYTSRHQSGPWWFIRGFFRGFAKGTSSRWLQGTMTSYPLALCTGQDSLMRALDSSRQVHHHSLITASSLHHHCIVTASSLHPHCIVT
eukprot:CAMPEP_0179417240 /NCGR_PEP_ID=MMETSP0799-20121207/7255_1 /TAXON_ID=46947 /ORGANISM="Geminigera cryophila, Strain CCMP2564" /LENGTH=261 /DNA_ID=CAMNT_0021190223 /DNA_START=33 /DNA_END=814 /DNA_ORIENTATION=+